MWAGGSLFIITTYTFNDQKVAVGGSIWLSAMAKSSTSPLTMNSYIDNQIRSHCLTTYVLNHNLHQFTKNTFNHSHENITYIMQ